MKKKVNFLFLKTETNLFYNLQLFYWHFIEILWTFIFLIFYNSSLSNLYSNHFKLLFYRSLISTFLIPSFLFYSSWGHGHHFNARFYRRHVTESNSFVRRLVSLISWIPNRFKVLHGCCGRTSCSDHKPK